MARQVLIEVKSKMEKVKIKVRLAGFEIQLKYSALKRKSWQVFRLN